MSTTTARGRRKRSRDQGDSAAATSSDSAAATSTSQLHTDALAHVAAAYAAVDGYAVAREEKAAQRNPNPNPNPKLPYCRLRCGREQRKAFEGGDEVGGTPHLELG